MAAQTGVAETGVPTFAEMDARVVSIGSVLFILADLFYFAAWWFAFFYLRARASQDNNAWLIKGVTHPNSGYGAFVIALIALSAIALWVAVRGTSKTRVLWGVLAPVAFVLGTAAALLGGYQLWHLGFGMNQGGYPSVYVGLWGSIVVQVGAAMVWLLSTLLQQGPAGDTTLRPHGSRGFARMLAFIAAASVASYLILYFVT